jgi:hypothetical protein
VVTSSNLQTWARVDIVIKDLQNPSTSKTLQFTNRPAQLGDATYLPLLKSYSGLSLSVGQDGLPSSGNGTITISDQWESLGEHRRIFDYFDRYTPINQAVTVYRAIETIGDLDMPSSWTLIYTGKIESYTKDKETLSFSVSNSLVESKIITKTITEDLAPTGFEVPESSIGKSLPLIFGSTNSIVPALSIAYSDADKSTAYYAYRSQFGTQFVEGSGDKAVYAKDLLDQYVEVKPNSYYASTKLQNGASGANTPTSHGLVEFIAPLDYDLEGCIVTGLKWWCRGLGGGFAGTGKIVLSLYRRPIDAPLFGDVVYPQIWERIASIEVNKSDYTSSFNAGSDFWVYGVLENPVIIKDHPEDYSAESYYTTRPPSYAVGVYLTNYTGSSTTDATSGLTNPFTSNQYYLYRSSTAGDSSLAIVTSGGLPLVGINVADFTYTAGSTDSEGFSYKYLSLTQDALNDRKCDLQQLDLAVSAPAIKDDGSGTITGTIDKLLYEPDEVCKLLGFTWNGSTWADGNIIDTSTYSALTTVFTSGNYQRSVKGFTEGDTSAYDLIGQIAKEMCCFLVPLSSGKLALWPFGSELSVTRVFTDAEILELGSIQETDPSTVINNIKISYNKDYLNINDQWEASGQAANSGGVLVVNKSTSDFYSTLLTNSETLYGKRELEESGSQFIGDETSATTRALYFATRHEHTHRTFNITVKYFDNTDLKLMDVIDVLSVHLPAYFGTSSKARLPTHEGEDVDIYKGEYCKSAQRRRCQIIGLNNDYDGDFPKLVITCREIKSRHPNDPTAENL